MFEYRYGLTDGARHTLEQTGEKFNISKNRVCQLIARVKYEIGKASSGTAE